MGNYRRYSTADIKPAGQFVKWDERGKFAEGTWVRSENHPSFKDNEGSPRVQVVFIERDTDEEKSFLVLTAMFNYFNAVFGGIENVPKGAAFRVTYASDMKIKGQPQPMKVFEFEFDDEDPRVKAFLDRYDERNEEVPI